MLSEAHADHSTPEADWPMPIPEVRRLLEPTPRWAPPPSDDGERDGD